MDPKEKAAMLNQDPTDHKNCCQSVLGALADSVGLDEETAVNIGTCLGGGCMYGGICGAIAGALMYTGLKYGSSPETKSKGSAILKKFREKYGCVDCRELVASAGGDRRQICPLLIGDGVQFALEA